MRSFGSNLNKGSRNRSNFILKSSSRKKLFFGSIDPGKVSVIRVYPAVEDGVVFPARNGPGEGDFTPWGRGITVAEWVGADRGRKISFVDELPPDHGEFELTPFSILYDFLNNRTYQGPGVNWNEIPHPKDGNSWVKPPSQCGVVQCAVFINRGEKMPEPDLHGVFLLKKTAAEALIGVLSEPNPDFDGEPDDYAGMYLHGDLFDPDSGKTLLIGGVSAVDNYLSHPGESDQEGSGFDLTGSGGGSGFPGTSGDSSSRGLQRTFYTAKPFQISKVPEDLIKECWRPWDGVVNVMQPDKQVELLCSVIPPQIMKAAFKETDWLPDSIKNGKTINAVKLLSPDKQINNASEGNPFDLSGDGIRKSESSPETDDDNDVPSEEVNTDLPMPSGSSKKSPVDNEKQSEFEDKLKKLKNKQE